MRRTLLATALALLAALPVHAQQATRIDDAAMARAATLRETALADDTGWKVVESLTTEVGPRLAGSEADARAVEWAKAKFKSLVYFAAGLPRDDAAITRALAQVGVAELAARKPHQLSGGQAQRVALARAVLLAPQLLLADEPTASLDDEAAADALALLQQSAAACDASLVIATHDQRVVQPLAGVQQLNLNEIGAQRLLDKREQL